MGGKRGSPGSTCRCHCIFHLLGQPITQFRPYPCPPFSLCPCSIPIPAPAPPAAPVPAVTWLSHTAETGMLLKKKVRAKWLLEDQRHLQASRCCWRPEFPGTSMDLRNIYLHPGLSPSWGFWMLPLYEYLLQQMIIFPCCSPLVCILFVCLASGVLCFPITLLFTVFSCSVVIYPTISKKNNLGIDSCFFDCSFLSWGFVLL